MSGVSTSLPVMALGLLFSAGHALAAPVTVNALGVGGWVSGDTRIAGGSAANAAQTAAQIKFLGEGQVVVDAAGATPDASPTGSLNGAGFVRLDGTSANSGKSDIGYSDAGGLAAARALLDPGFSASYRVYTDPNPSPYTVGFGITITNGLSNCGPSGTGACFYTFSYQTALSPNAWRTETVGASTGLFRLFGSGASGGSGPSKTLTDWSTDPTWGFLFDSIGDYDVQRVNFNIGSFQPNALAYIDWVQTTLLNGGDRVDFVSADQVNAVPAPGTASLAGLALAALGLARRRKA